jgi:hypothetical protein
MAHTSSGSLSPGSSYSLGQYTFSIQNVVSEGERILQAHCSGPDGSAAHGISVPESTQLLSWSVEADETEATVYAEVKGRNPVEGDIHSVVLAETEGAGYHFGVGTGTHPYYFLTLPITSTCTIVDNQLILASAIETSGTVWVNRRKNEDGSSSSGDTGYGNNYNQFTYEGKTVWYCLAGVVQANIDSGLVPVSEITEGSNALVAWTMIYGTESEGSINKLVARFAIDLEDAGGGPGGGWDDPGDTGSGTLHLTVTGASAGTHAATNVPKNNGYRAGYGCGGQGGYGGGGGAGASTVVIYRFATSRAGSKDIQANARPHGNGSKGGKGGKGGDGIILVYYSLPITSD